MRPAHVTAHVVERYRERIKDLTDEEIWRILDAPIFHRAIALGAIAVRLPCGRRVMIRDGCLTTVVARKTGTKLLARDRDQFHGRRRYSVPDAPGVDW